MDTLNLEYWWTCCKSWFFIELWALSAVKQIHKIYVLLNLDEHRMPSNVTRLCCSKAKQNKTETSAVFSNEDSTYEIDLRGNVTQRAACLRKTVLRSRARWQTQLTCGSCPPRDTSRMETSVCCDPRRRRSILVPSFQRNNRAKERKEKQTAKADVGSFVSAASLGWIWFVKDRVEL